MINLGDRAKDKVTGFSGIVIAKTTWLHGCERITIQPEKLDKEGKVKETQTFDYNQVEVVKSSVVKATPVVERQKAPGGPRDDKAALRR